MKPANGYVSIELVDNLITDAMGFKFIGKRGKINNDQLQKPNEGRLNGKRVWFYNHDMYVDTQTVGNVLIPETNIFLVENEVQGDGIIVKAEKFEWKTGGFVHFNQDVFQVKLSNCKDMPRGNLVVIQENTSNRFNRGGVVYAYIEAPNVLLNISKQRGVEAGRDKVLVERTGDILGDKLEGCGLINGDMVYFTKELAVIELSNVEYSVVFQRDIYGRGD